MKHYSTHFDMAYNIKEGVVKINVGKSKPGKEDKHMIHEQAKFKLAYLLKKQGRRVYTEVIFKGGKSRADIVTDSVSWKGLGLVLEILNSETEKQALKKLDYYPEFFLFETYDAEEVLKEGFDL